MALKSLGSLPAWQKKKVLPQSRHVRDYYCQDRCGHNAVCIKDELIIWGGYNDTNENTYCDNTVVWVYNLDLDVWTQYKIPDDAPAARSGACSALIWPYWYVFCGHTSVGDVNDMHRLDLINLTWEKMNIAEPSISPRDKASTWVYRNRIYCFGGFGSPPYAHLWEKDTDVFSEEAMTSRGWNDQLLYFDTVQCKWVNVLCEGQKPKERAAHSSVCVGDTVYIFGGRHRSNRLNDLHCLHLETNTWSGRINCQGIQPSGRSWHSMTRVSKTDLLLFGGFDNNRMPQDDLWMFNTIALSWTLLLQHSGFPRLWHSACVTSQIDILIFGGCVNNILDDASRMVTSDKVLVVRTGPFSLERLCLHILIKHKDLTHYQWHSLLKSHQEWLSLKSITAWEFRPPHHQNCAETLMGPDVCQLSVLSDMAAEMLNNNR